jgi:hypothetical protein
MARKPTVAALALFLALAAGSASARSVITLVGAASGDNFGGAVAGAGDVNGDGVADVIVGAYSSDAGGMDAGQAYVYFGGTRPDAKPDLVLTGEAPGDLFGVSVAGAGDVNQDGFADVLVGAYENDFRGANAGRAYLFLGGQRPDSKPDLVLTGEAAGDAFGYAVASAGDVNGDGAADFLVGAYENSARGAGSGRAYVYYGGAGMDSRPDLTLSGEAAGDLFGISVSSAGDVNGDGHADIVVGAYQNDAGGANAGRAYVYFGGPRADDRADLVLTGASAGDLFGFSVSSAGDVNRDGNADVIVGAYHNDAGGADAGRAYVYFGGARPDGTADLVLTGEAAGDAFGYSVACGGDTNGDGFDDVLVGAYGNDAGGSASGRAYAFYGGAAPDAVPDFTVTGEATLDNLGYAVSSTGDFDADGDADLIVTAPFADAGRAYAVKPAGRVKPVAER